MLLLASRPSVAAGPVFPLQPDGPSTGTGGQACRAEASRAEQEEGLPPGLLLAIGREESGRWDAASRAVLPWPFAINAAGQSHFFETSSDASGFVAARLRAGMESIDVGCFQINLHYHPQAFASLTEAFDPRANARYAARFLKMLYSETRSWEAAVGRYHSAVPGLARPYQEAVFRRWDGTSGSAPISAGTEAMEMIAGVMVQRPSASSGHGVAPSLLAGLPRVITP